MKERRRITHTQICTLLSAVTDICPDDKVVGEIVRMDRDLQESSHPKTNYNRLLNIANHLHSGIVFDGWKLQDE